jgi:hypothetical protein
MPIQRGERTCTERASIPGWCEEGGSTSSRRSGSCVGPSGTARRVIRERRTRPTSPSRSTVHAVYPMRPLIAGAAGGVSVRSGIRRSNAASRLAEGALCRGLLCVCPVSGCLRIMRASDGSGARFMVDHLLNYDSVRTPTGSDIANGTNQIRRRASLYCTV